jgi:hypothetical protein
MIATSPVRHEPPPNLHLAPIEVHHQCKADVTAIGSVGTTAPPWKALSDFALQTELDQPPFQQLVSSFGESSGDEDDDTVVCLDEPSRIRRNQITAAVRMSQPVAASLYHLNRQSPPLQPMTHYIANQHIHHQAEQSIMYSSLATADASC